GDAVRSSRASRSSRAPAGFRWYAREPRRHDPVGPHESDPAHGRTRAGPRPGRQWCPWALTPFGLTLARRYDSHVVAAAASSRATPLSSDGPFVVSSATDPLSG